MRVLPGSLVGAVLIALFAAIAATTSGCATGPIAAAPGTGTVTIGVTTTDPRREKLEFGVEIMPAGIRGAIGADAGVFTARNTPAGDQIVRLKNVPARCSIDGKPERAVTVSTRRTTAIRFAVTCK